MRLENRFTVWKKIEISTWIGYHLECSPNNVGMPCITTLPALFTSTKATTPPPVHTATRFRILYLRSTHLPLKIFCLITMTDPFLLPVLLLDSGYFKLLSLLFGQQADLILENSVPLGAVWQVSKFKSHVVLLQKQMTLKDSNKIFPEDPLYGQQVVLNLTLAKWKSRRT